MSVYVFEVYTFKWSQEWGLDSIASSVLATLVKLNSISGNWQIAVIIIPLLSAAAIFSVSQLRLFDHFRVWEGGRLEFDKIVADGRRRLVGATNDSEYTQIHKELIDQVTETDRTYTRELCEIMGRQLAKHEKDHTEV